MGKLLLIGTIGFPAQLVDGALGMAYGVSSTTLLLAIGSAPAVASATVHLAEVGTVAVLAVSHWRFGNVESRTVRLMSLPGFVGAFLGAGAVVAVGRGRRAVPGRVAVPARYLRAGALAAWVVRKLPPRILGSAVVSVILITNAKTIVEAAGPAETAAVVAYVAIVLLSLALLSGAIVTLRRDTRTAGATA